MLSKVLSCPPCIEPLELNTQAGLLCNAPLSHKLVVWSQKYFISLAILPKRVGEQEPDRYS